MPPQLISKTFRQTAGLAASVSQADGADAVDAQHLLIAALLQPASVASQIIDRLSRQHQRFGDVLVALRRHGSKPPMREVVSSESCKALIRSSMDVATELRHSCISTGHLLIAACGTESPELESFARASG